MIFSVTTDVTLAAATTKTAIRFNTHATARRARIVRVFVGDQSVTSTDQPVLVTINRNRGADGTGTTFVPVLQFGSASGTVLGVPKVNYTVEPTAGTPELLDKFECPTGSAIDLHYDGPEDRLLDAAVNSNISIELVAAQARANTVTVTCWIRED